MTSPQQEWRTLTVGEVAGEAGVAASAVRFYERHGLVTATRTSGNARRFTPDAPCRIKVARVAQRVGLTVREIAAILEPMPVAAGAEEWGRVAEQLVAEARRRISELEVTLADLASGSRLCDLTTP